MPCNMYEGMTAGDFAWSAAQDAKKRADEAMVAANKMADIRYYGANASGRLNDSNAAGDPQHIHGRQPC